jgi:hypothetical protein
LELSPGVAQLEVVAIVVEADVIDIGITIDDDRLIDEVVVTVVIVVVDNDLLRITVTSN